MTLNDISFYWLDDVTLLSLNLVSHHKSVYRVVCPWCREQWGRGSSPEWLPIEPALPAGLGASYWPLPKAPLSLGWSDGPLAWVCWGPVGALWKRDSRTLLSILETNEMRYHGGKTGPCRVSVSSYMVFPFVSWALRLPAFFYLQYIYICINAKDLALSPYFKIDFYQCFALHHTNLNSKKSHI